MNPLLAYSISLAAAVMALSIGRRLFDRAGIEPGDSEWTP